MLGLTLKSTIYFMYEGFRKSKSTTVITRTTVTTGFNLFQNTPSYTVARQFICSIDRFEAPSPPSNLIQP